MSANAASTQNKKMYASIFEKQKELENKQKQIEEKLRNRRYSQQKDSYHSRRGSSMLDHINSDTVQQLYSAERQIKDL